MVAPRQKHTQETPCCRHLESHQGTPWGGEVKEKYQIPHAVSDPEGAWHTALFPGMTKAGDQVPQFPRVMLRLLPLLPYGTSSQEYLPL